MADTKGERVWVRVHLRRRNGTVERYTTLGWRYDGLGGFHHLVLDRMPDLFEGDDFRMEHCPQPAESVSWTGGMEAPPGRVEPVPGTGGD